MTESKSKSDMIQMQVTGLTIDPFTNMPIVIMKDLEGNVALPVWIGLIEASAIATELEHIELSRPMTHDLIKTILDELHVKVARIEIIDLMDNTFFATIHFKSKDKDLIVDCRPSDAIAVALRSKAAIFVDRAVIEKSRQIETNHQSEDQMKSQKWSEILENLTPADFGKYKM